MESLKNTVNTLVSKVKPYIPKISTAGGTDKSAAPGSNLYIKSIVIVFAVIILTLFLMFVGGWFYNTAVKKNADLSILIQLLTLMCSSGFVAMVIALLKFGVDKDGNGIPDILEDNSSTTSDTTTNATVTSGVSAVSTDTSKTAASSKGISATGAVKTHGD